MTLFQRMVLLFQRNCIEIRGQRGLQELHLNDATKFGDTGLWRLYESFYPNRSRKNSEGLSHTLCGKNNEMPLRTRQWCCEEATLIGANSGHHRLLWTFRATCCGVSDGKTVKCWSNFAARDEGRDKLTGRLSSMQKWHCMSRNNMGESCQIWQF